MRKFWIIVSLLLILFGCKKNELPNTHEDFIVIDSNDIANIYQYNPYINLHPDLAPHKTNIEIDLNNDGIIDVEIVYSYVNTGGSYYITRTIKSRHDSVSIGFKILIDSIITYQGFEGDTLITYFTENYNSKKQYENIQALSIDTTYSPEIFHNGDIINDSIQWKPGTFILNYYYSSWCGVHNSKYYCYPQYSKHINQGLWKDIIKEYIGLRMKINNEIYYSWIQISTDNAISIYQYKIIR